MTPKPIAEWVKAKRDAIPSEGVELTIPLAPIAEDLKHDGAFTLGVEYGYLQALRDIFG